MNVVEHHPRQERHREQQQQPQRVDRAREVRHEVIPVAPFKNRIRGRLRESMYDDDIDDDEGKKRRTSICYYFF